MKLTPEQEVAAKLADYPYMLAVVSAAHYVLENYMPEDEQEPLDIDDPILELDRAVKRFNEHIKAARKALRMGASR